MKRVFRIIACLLSVAVLLNTSSVTIWASSRSYDQSFVDEDNLHAESDSSLGNLVLNTLNDEQPEESENVITGLSIEGNVGIVEVQIAEACEVVVAIYDEEGIQMLASGNQSIGDAQGVQSVEVKIETDRMPKYFIAKAFLLDIDTHRPLCKAYTNENYTQKFEEFMEKTVDDFQKEDVVELDRDKSTNFLVYDENTVRIEENGMKNVVTAADDASGIYTMAGVGEEVKNLRPGDVFSYTYENGEILAGTVKSVSQSGDNAVIQITKDTVLEDVFSYVKIDTESLAEDMIADTSTADEEVQFLDNGESLEPLLGADMEGEISKALKMQVKDEASGLNGSAALELKLSLKVYIDFSYQYTELKLDEKLSSYISVDKNFDKQYKLGKLTATPIAGLSISYSPVLLVEASGTISFSTEMKQTIGFAYSNKDGLQSKNKGPELTCDFKMEGKVYLGVGGEVQAELLGNLANLSLQAEVGPEINGAKTGDGEDPAVRHQCSFCIEGEINTRAELNAGVDFLGKTVIDKTLLKGTYKVKNFYYSKDFNEFGWDKTCPHISYKVTVNVVDSSNIPVINALISGVSDDENYRTDGNGQVVFYLPTGSYQLKVSSGDLNAEEEIVIQDKGKTITIKLKQEIKGPENPDPGKDSEWKGSYVYMGHYLHKKGAIRWRVLEIANGEMLLMADEIIDFHSWTYDMTGNCRTWRDSGMRKYLNEELLFEIFDEEERAAIVKSKVKMDLSIIEINGEYVNGGPDTEDYMYLPSRTELRSSAYGFSGNSSRIAKYTDANSSHIQLKDETAYWLRTPGTIRYGFFYPMFCGDDGVLYVPGMRKPPTMSMGVRPMIRVAADSDAVKSQDLLAASESMDSGVLQSEEAPEHEGFVNEDSSVGTDVSGFKAEEGDLTENNERMQNVDAENSAFTEEKADFDSEEADYIWGFTAESSDIGESDEQNEKNSVEVPEDIIEKIPEEELLAEMEDIPVEAGVEDAVVASSEENEGSDDDVEMQDSEEQEQVPDVKYTVQAELPAVTIKEPESNTKANVQTAQFSDLAAGGEYVYIVVKTKSTSKFLAADNLLYIDQKTADGDGKVSYSYLLREQAAKYEADVYGGLLSGGITNEKPSLKVAKRTTDSVTLSWDKIQDAMGYTIWYRSEHESKVKRTIIRGGSNTSWVHKSLKPGTKYFYTVKAWIKEDGKYIFSEQSAVQRGTTKPQAAKIKNVTVTNRRIKVTLTGTAKGAEMYSMCYSSDKNFDDFKVGIRTSGTVRSFRETLKPGTYYVRVKSYRDLGNHKRVYGEWSNTVKVIVE